MNKLQQLFGKYFQLGRHQHLVSHCVNTFKLLPPNPRTSTVRRITQDDITRVNLDLCSGLVVRHAGIEYAAEYLQNLGDGKLYVYEYPTYVDILPRSYVFDLRRCYVRKEK